MIAIFINLLIHQDQPPSIHVLYLSLVVFVIGLNQLAHLVLSSSGVLEHPSHNANAVISLNIASRISQIQAPQAVLFIHYFAEFANSDTKSTD